MTDKFSKETRSRIMSRIRSKRTSPEKVLRKALWGKGFIYQPKMVGNPDFAHKKRKIILFIDGDFWHGYNWKKLGKVPPKKYWQGKIERNIKRDKKYNKMLKEKGYKVIRFWEHEIETNLNACVKEILNLIP